MRIGKFGWPGAGKSSGAAGLFHDVKRHPSRVISIELAREVVKDWVYYKRDIKPLDQISLLGMQWNEEFKYLGHGVKNVITDSPIFLGYIYAKKYFSDHGLHEHILGLVERAEFYYPSINIFLERGDKPYDPNGRHQDLDGAREIDLFIKSEMDRLGMNYKTFDTDDREGILNFVIDNCE
jgi:hypothetical protein